MIFIKCQDENDGGKIAANYVIKQLLSKSNSVFLFPTGHSPETMYANLASESLSKGYDWSKVISFNLDEYYQLNPKYEFNSYHAFMQQNLFSKVNIDPANIYFPYKNGQSETEISSYDDLIDSVGGIDLAILGVGSNGHIAFNEPGTVLDSVTRIVKLTSSTRTDNSRYFDNDLNNVPSCAVSCGISTILKAKKILLIAYGQNKKAALEQLKQAKEFDTNWPVTALVNANNVVVITDLDL